MNSKIDLLVECNYKYRVSVMFLCEISFVICTQMLRVVWGHYPDRHNVVYRC